jgi:hypothetical protein
MFEAYGSLTVSQLNNHLSSSAYWGPGMTADAWGAGFVQADGATGA